MGDISYRSREATTKQVRRQNLALFQLAAQIDQKTAAITESINCRIDRIEVVNDPEKTVSIGREQIEVTQQREL